MASLVGVAVAVLGLEAWLSWWIDDVPRLGVAPTLGTLRGSHTLDGLWDPTLRVDDGLGWTLREGQGLSADRAWLPPADIGRYGNRLTGSEARWPVRHRVAAFGDSFTFGFEATDEGTYPARLAVRLGEGWVVTNHGVTGYGNDQVALALDRWLPEVRPDVVILAHAPDDIWRNELAWTYGPKRRSRLEAGAWSVAQGPVPAIEDARRDWLRRPLVRHLPALVREAWSHGGKAEQIALATAIVRAQVARVEAAEAVPILVHLSVHRDPSRWHGVVRAVCAERPILCLDTEAALDATAAAGHPVYAPHSMHYSEPALDAVAAALVPLVRSAVDAP